ncbi:sensor histidine kinase [Parapedobacter koreensis]|uniref:histidine kinase n=1 Tax=Parapedobacter koreensis TaxID=332977 RepID=A0A1H7QX60_9SPHI|nr:sensor histidine kinase [Parapedobacter koreensis]SEL52513.1 Two component regulator propeller [Parapedobacter koreensis]
MKPDTPSSNGKVAYTVPVSESFSLPEAKPINWKIYPQDSVPKRVSVKFDLDKLPFKRFSAHEFAPLKRPLKTTRFDWEKLETIPLELDTIKGTPFSVKKFMLPKPVVTQASAPGLWEKSTSSILKLSQAEGLPGNNIYCMMTDQEGSVWFATERGLNKYTGTEFLNYGFLTRDGVPRESIFFNMLIDQEGRLLISGSTSGLYRLDIKTGVVEYFTIGNGFPRMTFDNTGKLWGTKPGSGVFFLDLDKKLIFSLPLKANGFDVTNAYCASMDANGNLWIGFYEGIGIIDPAFTSMRLIGEAEGLPIQLAYGFTEDISGAVWITALSPGALAVSLKEQTISTLGAEQGYHGATYDVFTDKLDRVWLLANDTVSIYDRKSSRIKKMVTGAKIVTALPPSSGMKGADGTIWLGSNADGVLLMDPSGMLADRFSVKDGLVSENIWGITEDSKGRIWLASYEGINVYDPATDKLSLLKLPPSVSTNEYRQIRKIRKDVFLVGAADGFGIIDLPANTATFYNTRDKQISSTCFGGIETPDGNIWMVGDDGLFVFNPQDHSIKSLGEQTGLTASLAYVIQQDQQGRIWVLTDRGANVIDPRANTIVNLKKSNGLLSSYTSMLFQSQQGDIYIGTDVGMDVFDKDLKTMTHISAKNGMYPPAMYDIIERNGRIQIGSENGIIVVEQPGEAGQPWRFYNYAKSAGFSYNDYNQATGFVSSTGQAWWSAAPVLIVAHQDPLIDTIPPRVSISGMSIMDQRPSFLKMAILNEKLAEGDTLWWDSTAYVHDQFPADTGYLAKNKIHWDSIQSGFQLPVGLKLPYHQNSFTFSFVNQDVRARDRIVYRYMLEGADNKWSVASTAHTSRIYYNIKPGHYSFKVITRGFNGVWSEPDVLNFTILPPWWQTWWAYVLFILLAGGIVYLIVRVRSQWLEKENKLLEEKVNDRTRELNQKMEELRSTQNQLIQSEKMASLGELTAGIAHEIQNPLNFVNNFSEVSNELLDEMKDELAKGNHTEAVSIADDLKQNLEKINHHGKRADSIVKGMLQHSRSNSGLKEPTDVNALADEYLRLAYHGLRAKNQSFKATLKTDFDQTVGKIRIIPQDMGRVILNLITNAFYAVTEKKNQIGEGFEPTVTVKTQKTDGNVEISVHDNGNGIPGSVLDKIFQPFFTTKPTGEGTGLGLSLAYDIVKAHNGTLQVETSANGTVFIIRLPAA